MSGHLETEGQPPELVLAPIRGITDAVYRQAFAECFGGFDYTVAPFVRPRQGHALRPGELRQLAPCNNRGLRVVPQVLTNHAPTFASCLKELADLGYSHVNWNLGCPHATTAGRGRGAGLLPHPERIASILDHVLDHTSVTLSAKLRLGHFEPDEVFAVIEHLNQYPLAEVALHPRTAAQMYDGPIDAERAAEACAICNHRFIHSGDIDSADSLRTLRDTIPGVSAWMVGRGVLRHPSLASELRGMSPPPDDSRRRALRTFHNRLLEGYSRWLSGPAHLLNKMKEHWAYLSASFDNPRKVVRLIRRSRTEEDYLATTSRVLDGFPLSS